MVAFGAANNASTNVGGEHPNVDVTNSGNNDALITGLPALGHTVNMAAQSSGIGTIVRRSNPRAATTSMAAPTHAAKTSCWATCTGLIKR